jgi:hypothetical protein
MARGTKTMRTLCKKLAFVLPVIAAASIAQADDLYVAGPFSLVSANGHRIAVLGQTLDIRPTTKFFIRGKRVAESKFLSELDGASFIYAEASDRSGKLEANKVLLVDNHYVPGASIVFLSGRVSKYERSIGRLNIGDAELDVNNISPSVLGRLEAGDVVETSGVQPLGQSLLVLSNELKVASEPHALGMGERIVSTQGISGSGIAAQGISGVDSSLQGISGSGKAADGISGSGVSAQGISGSGIALQGISGSGKAAQGISGSGASIQGISGSGIATQGISGSGANTQGISGSGIATQGISGSGKVIQGISGSGVNVQGISGSGASTQGISGSGKTAQGISGSGVQAQGISGSGIAVQGISGSGKSAQGISGSGVKTQGISGSGTSTQGISGSGTTVQN